jgi:hypothetical protein
MSLAFHETPNPNALKCVPASALACMAAVGNTPRSYAAAPSHDPFAAALFGIDGVVNVLITPQWFTVGKAPKANWKQLKTDVQRVFTEHQALEGTRSATRPQGEA